MSKQTTTTAVVGRTFYFEKDLWAKLDEDAKRCLRSSTKQMEAILKTYFGEQQEQSSSVELSESGLEMLGEIMPKGKKTVKVLPDTAKVGKKKAS